MNQPAGQGLQTTMCDTARRGTAAEQRDLAVVDVWRAELAVEDPGRLAELSGCLSQEERLRAYRFHFELHRSRFIAARGILRVILARYLDQAPDLVRFSHQANGKPVLADDRDLHFNISHSEDLLVVGVSEDRPLGVDIEPVPPDQVVDEVSPLVFSIPEREVLGRLPPAHRRESFARFWTRKEAYIKADGRGMSLPLRDLDVATLPGRVLLLDHDSSGWFHSPDWCLRSLPIGYGTAGALAARGDWQVAWHSFPCGL